MIDESRKPNCAPDFLAAAVRSWALQYFYLLFMVRGSQGRGLFFFLFVTQSNGNAQVNAARAVGRPF
jgi:hypothetical protein